MGAEGEVVEGCGGELEAGGGGADLEEAVLQEVDLEVGLLLEGLELVDAQLLHLSHRRRRRRRRHGSSSTFFFALF